MSSQGARYLCSAGWLVGALLGIDSLLCFGEFNNSPSILHWGMVEILLVSHEQKDILGPAKAPGTYIACDIWCL
jgi:hypothetical protein